ncbi:high-affinity glucose transporter Hxt2p [Trichomonascus vanleenenianus]|uniref:high-affinity glucose transporter Hxt2p n=1 Tax=Trichomonascus vanleenenianus TaxID=2268995 RepID=UPI003EC9EDAC
MSAEKEQTIVDTAAAEHAENIVPVKTGIETRPVLDVIKENKPDTFGKGMIQLYAICGLVYLTATMSGYDGSMMGSINALGEFRDYFGINKASSTGLIFSIYNIGVMVGACFIWLQDFRGRKFGIIVGCIGVIVSTIIMATCKSLNAFIGGRFLLAVFTVIAAASGPTYCVEIAPPQFRGTVSGLCNTLWYLGSIIAAFTILGCDLHHPGSAFTFRLPLWIQMVCPGIILIGVWFLPESPRWLIANDRQEEARKLIIKYHANGDETHPLVDLEMAEMIASLEGAPLSSWKTFLNLGAIVGTKADRYRFLLIVLISWFAQFSGNNVSSYYFPTMLKAVGITSPSTQILMNGIYGITGWIAATIGARLLDIVGRRKMFLSSTLGMSVCMAIVAATTATFQKTGSHAASSASIAFIFIFGIVYAICFTSLTPIYPSEVSNTKLRARSMMLHQIVGGCASFVNQYAAPIAMQNIGYWFYVFFALWDIVEAVVIYFLFVETKGRSLEELEEIFHSSNPRKFSTKKPTTVVLSV